MKVNRKCKTMLSAVMAGIICMAGGITALAYNPSNLILSDTEYNIGISVSVVSEKTEQEWEALPYDYYCIDENGGIYDLDNVDEEARGLCIHEFRNRSIIDHQEDGKWNVQLKLITRRFVSSVDLRRLRY